MSRFSSKLGIYAAITSITSFILFVVMYLCILKQAPVFIWDNLEKYILYVTSYPQTYKHVAQALMFMFGISYTVMIHSIHNVLPKEKKYFSKLSISFANIFTTLICIHYFVQLTTVRFSMINQTYNGLENIVQANPYSVSSVINMLGWTIFFSLSSFAIAPVFPKNKRDNIIKLAFILNGIFCFFGGVGFLFEWKFIVFVTMNIGMGLTVLLFSIPLIFFFQEHKYTFK